MTDGRANVKLSREFYNEHNPQREELGLTWEEYIEGNAPDVADAVDTDRVAREVARQLDYEHLAGKVAEKVADRLR